MFSRRLNPLGARRSADDDSDDMTSPDDGAQNNVAGRDRASSSSAGLFLSEDDRLHSPSAAGAKPLSRRKHFAPFELQLPPVKRRKTYLHYPEEYVVHRVLREVSDGSGQSAFEVRCGDGKVVTLPSNRLLRRPNGPTALSAFQEASSSQSEASEMSEAMSSSHRRQAGAKRARPAGFVDTDSIDLTGDSEDEGITMSSRASSRPKRLRRGLQSGAAISGRSRPSKVGKSAGRGTRPSHAVSLSSSPDVLRSGGPAPRQLNTRSMRSKGTAPAPKPNYANDTTMISGDELASGGEFRRSSSTDSFPFVVSDLYPPTKEDLAQMKRRKKGGRGGSGTPVNTKRRKVIHKRRAQSEESSYDEGIFRRSGRTGRTAVNMRERGEDEIWASSDDEELRKTVPRAIGVREVFQELPRSNSFRNFHCQWCDTCGQYGSNKDRGNLVFCQGCTASYHRTCVGRRQERQHLVTKVRDQDFVLQCRRCVRMSEKRDPLAPRQDWCQVCKKPGAACAPFQERKTTRQQQKEREDNGGQDPIVAVDQSLLNDAQNLLFRCTSCQRGFHFHHLPPLGAGEKMDVESDTLADRQYAAYSEQWKCLDCINIPAEVQLLVAWRPVDVESYAPGASVDMVVEDEKEYLVKWKKLSYHHVTWLPGPWVWGVTPSNTRLAFANKSNGYCMPKMTVEDAVPEEFYRVDIVLDVRYTSIVSVHTEEIDKARIREVKEALVKFKGLGYEEVVWQKPPTPEDGDRWTDFVTAYDDWVLGRYIHLPKQHYLKERLEKVRTQDFQTKLLKQKQPENLTGGEMMGYQMEGLNWAYYKWYKQQNAILADEMGLGKTIQIIGLLATLVQDHKCWPFLVVVPNSTCPNWRREFKLWAPSLRVVAYYGSSEARKLAMQHELYPDGSKDLKCHVVVTSYEAPADDSSKKFFRNVPWAGLIVDEGQRLKNDKNQLYEALSVLAVPFKILMTGTPLQNNARELFNLLQFLDSNIIASELEEEYAALTTENISRLHDLIRPFFLRRTKAQVLTFLPPMAQVIIPVTMSLVQKKLYKSILAKSPDLIKSIYNRQKLKQTERHNLNNILMQLRKCLCHPFVFSQAIEERDVSAATSHRTLVEASSKLQLLDIMLPKLRERGHRVLIFSQFLNQLDIIEDFLDGLGLPFQRLDGSIGTLQKQKRIDEFNAPNSPLFAFLLSTRAGGVGINLATADTVIIMDPDFNPHQDIQALSRAHRIGQKKKVLVFQLMTRDSAEEKIVQVGRKKMALDHVLVEQMDAEEDVGLDLESILLHGTNALFDEDNQRDIHYDSASVDKLLDRSQAENTKTGDDSSAESQFSFARIWANDNNELKEGFEESSGEERLPDPTVWDKILQEREHQAAIERAARQQTFGRGKRRRQTVEYNDSHSKAVAEDPSSPPSPSAQPPHRTSDSDTDFQARAEVSDADTLPSDAEQEALRDSNQLASNGMNPVTIPANQAQPPKSSPRGPPLRSPADPGRYGFPPPLPAPPPHRVYQFQRAKIPLQTAASPNVNTNNPSVTANPLAFCLACSAPHPPGHCPLKLAGAERCPLCNVAHFGDGPVCPHLKSETQVRAMMDALKKSPESREMVDQALVYLRGRKGHLVRVKKEKEKKGEGARPGSQGSVIGGVGSGGRGSGGVVLDRNGTGSLNGEGKVQEVVDLT